MVSKPAEVGGPVATPVISPDRVQIVWSEDLLCKDSLLGHGMCNVIFIIQYTSGGRTTIPPYCTRPDGGEISWNTVARGVCSAPLQWICDKGLKWQVSGSKQRRVWRTWRLLLHFEFSSYCTSHVFRHTMQLDWCVGHLCEVWFDKGDMVLGRWSKLPSRNGKSISPPTNRGRAPRKLPHQCIALEGCQW